MKKFLILCVLLLTACAPSAPTAAPVTPSLPPTATATATATASVPPTVEPCGYMWASQDLPDVSKKINDLLQAVDTNITASAYAYGENCVYADGHSTFGAMETDYRVTVKVKDTKDENALGDSIKKVMDVIIAIPLSDVQGPNPGRVEFSFVNSSNQVNVVAQIDQYIHDAVALKGADLFKFFHQNP
jgi:hypothetical protein